jgi:hypothetical protein
VGDLPNRYEIFVEIGPNCRFVLQPLGLQKRKEGVRSASPFRRGRGVYITHSQGLTTGLASDLSSSPPSFRRGSPAIGRQPTPPSR